MLWLHNTAVMLRLHPIHRFPFRLLLLLLASLLFPLSSSQPDTASSDSYYQRCKEPHPFRCGTKEYSISYPFTADGVTEGCGRPDYALKCSGDGKDGNLTIRILDEDFKVLNISYHDGGGFLTVVEQDIQVDQSTCTVKHQDAATSINTTLFEFMPQDSNLTLFTCPPSTRPPTWSFPSYSPKSCGASNPPVWYLVLSTPMQGDFLSVIPGCDETTVVVKPPPGPDAARILSDPRSLQDALQQGFDVRWRAGSDWCAGCLRTGGICGYDTNNPDEQTCYCPDGTTKGDGSCKDGKGLNSKLKLVIGFAGLTFGVILAFAVGAFLWRRRKRRLEKGNSSVTASFFKSITPSTSSFGFGGGDLESSPGPGYYQTPVFTYQELEQATGGFAHELGDGGFGTVYKGKLKDGRVVAIKCLHQNTHRRVQQFRNEIEILNRLRHQNLVTLYGCSTADSPKLLLVYEFIPNGTVADHLHGHLSSDRALTWSLRMSIAIESAAALSYLHAVKPQIIHRDVKTSNILLDSDFHVKVADFGLSRLFPDLRVTHVSTAPQGTPGYVDPEYHQCYQLTDKSDVYSFGVVLVELVSSMPAVDITRNRNQINLSNLALEKIPAGLVGEMADARLGYGSDPEVTAMVNAVCELAFRCLQQERDMRPTMQEVLDELRRIQVGSAGEEKKATGHDKEKSTSRDDIYLLNLDSQAGSSPPFSPNTVNGTTTSWPSRSTTPNASC